MNWIVYSLWAAAALAAADVLVKLASGKVSTSLGLLLYGSVAFTVGLVWFLADLSRGLPAIHQSSGVAYALGVGLTFTMVTIAMYAAFNAGAPISLASPLIRLGGLIVASVVGVLLWKEPANARYIIGVALSTIGIILMMTR